MHPTLFPADCEHLSPEDAIQFSNTDFLTDVCSLSGHFFRFSEVSLENTPHGFENCGDMNLKGLVYLVGDLFLRFYHLSTSSICPNSSRS
jgi:hypothetical protein